MAVQSIGAAENALAPDPVQAIREHSPHAPAHQVPAAPISANDVSSALATQIAGSDLARLTAILEPRLSPEVTAHITDLVRDTSLALAQEDRTRALANITQIIASDPRTLPLLAPEQLLQTIRPEVDYLLNRLTTVARMDAEGWLSQADQALETPGHELIPNWQTRPETLLTVAHHLFDSGGYTNYLRSADLAQTVLNYGPAPYSPFLEQYAEALAPKPPAKLAELENEQRLPTTPTLSTLQKTVVALRTAARPKLLKAWRRAPLLVLLLSWLSAGLIAGPASILLRALWPDGWAVSLINAGFEIWGVGFLALVGLGFYARIRNIRSWHSD